MRVREHVNAGIWTGNSAAEEKQEPIRSADERVFVETRGMEVGRGNQIRQGSGTIRKAEDLDGPDLGFSSKSQYDAPKPTSWS